MNPSTVEIRNIIESIPDEKYRYAFMYQFLIGGNVSEICGKYKPKGTDAFTENITINYKTTPAVFFKIKTARRKGKLRICVLPLDSEYEPWSKPVFEWFKKHGKEPPFILSEKAKGRYSNQQYLSYFRKELFKQYNIPRHTKNYIRNARKKNLKEFYYFNELDLALFGSWNEPTTDHHIKTKIRSILSTKKKIEEKELKNETKQYFLKLLRPISQLKQEDDPTYLQVRDRADLQSRYRKAATITMLIKDINDLGVAKLDTPFFKEKMRIIIEILSPCNTQPQFTVKIASLAALFEVVLNKPDELMQRPNWRRYKGVLIRWLKEAGVDYDPLMFTTWDNIKSLRNMEPIHSVTDPKKLFKILTYFGQPMKKPINWSSLWDEILDKYILSLNQLNKILNDL